MQSGLLSLSTELVVLILDWTSNPTLVSIAKTCRRLHYLALPIYLARYGIASNPTPRSFVLREKALRALPGLSTACYVTSADDIWCKFQGPEEFYFQRGVVDLCCFVHGLSSVASVSLDVGNIDTRWVDGLATAASDTWKPKFIRMLDTALARGCKSLTVAHGHFLVSSSLLKASKPETVPRLSWLPRRKQRAKVDIAPGNTLAAFSIHTNMLLTPPFYDWTLHTLHANPITALSLRVPGLSQDAWLQILDALTLPSLSSFSAETIDIAFPALLLFLRRHPTITTLNLHPHFPHPRTTTLSKPKPANHRKNNLLPKLTTAPLLPSLAALGGSPGNTTALLSHLRADTALRVRDISLVLPMHQRLFHASDYDALTAHIVGVVKGRSVRPASLALRFAVPYETLRPPGDDGRAKALLSCVETLAFSTDGHYAFARWVVPSLPAWLGANFVQLRNVALSEDCVAGVDARRRQTVLQSIKDACPWVKNVIIAL
ncbi:hypothetical protein C0992_004702 [Termitomyces sp. T32_za158]|nr:hypothetical protein C0992_004702 [Termitomyces sp. T32_za158]